MPSEVILASGLVKRYGDLEAVAGIDFRVEQGECFGFLGVNGAGKTTTLRMVQCVLAPTAGQLRVLGRDVASQARQIKARLGVVPQADNLDPDLTVRENLRVYSRYFGIRRRQAYERIAELLRFVQLDERAHEQVANLSGGMQRRLVLARAMINSPQLMLLDEPTTGLDPQARHMVWGRLRSLRAAGVTMLLTTHYMEEAAQLCDRVAVIDAGQILMLGRPEELVREHVGERCIELRPTQAGREGLAERLADLDAHCEQAGDTVFIYPRGQLDWGAIAAIPHERLLERSASLEDLFLQLTGRELRR